MGPVGAARWLMDKNRKGRAIDEGKFIREGTTFH